MNFTSGKFASKTLETIMIINKALTHQSPHKKKLANIVRLIENVSESTHSRHNPTWPYAKRQVLYPSKALFRRGCPISL